MKTVKEVSRLTGVSVRALHHYDAIGLLRPAKITEAGYRLYDEENLQRLQQILLFRELQFPLKEIAAILDSPGFDPDEALLQQIRLLELRRERLDALIGLARDIQQKGVSSMNFDAFDTGEIDRYATEAKERWETPIFFSNAEVSRAFSAGRTTKKKLVFFLLQRKILFLISVPRALSISLHSSIASTTSFSTRSNGILSFFSI